MDLDDCMQLYIGHLYASFSGRHRHRAINAVFGLYAADPQLRHQLRRSEQLLNGWARVNPSLAHPPLTWPLATLLAAVMAKSGHTGCALATLVGFHALLRVSELMALRVEDVSVPTDPRRGLSAGTHSVASLGGLLSPRLCIRLAVTKTGSNQWSELYDERISALLARTVSDRPPDERVFVLPTFSSVRARVDHYRAVLHGATSACGVRDINYTPHSLRHGGATYAHVVLQQSIETIMHRGRWRSNDTCRAYIQAGAAHLLTLRHPPAIIAQAEATHVHWEELLLGYCFPSGSLSC